MKLLSWNICAGGGAKRRPQQLAAIAEAGADIVALQELTIASVDDYRDGLAAAGLGHVIDSFALAPSLRRLVGPRRYGQMIASRWPLTAMPPTEFAIPWRERVLSGVVSVPGFGKLEIHNTHVPPGASNGWTKIRHLEGVFKRLATAASVPRILLGDFNTPKLEHPDGRIETWGGVPSEDNRWDIGERNVLTKLASHDLHDAFRALHGYEQPAFSIVVRGSARRYDHVLSSRVLRPVMAEYVHLHREAKLSDHAPLMIHFKWDSKATPSRVGTATDRSGPASAAARGQLAARRQARRSGRSPR
ncbi:MAG TPA: endonuclease/exonuclease/phosphatase family protein [Kofleriaceae bacterium]|nr:endonuclease/exonuclease/phosphatase family protein [Kofleriaceae bacterium]